MQFCPYQNNTKMIHLSINKKMNSIKTSTSQSLEQAIHLHQINSTEMVNCHVRLIESLHFKACIAREIQSLNKF